MGQAKLRGTYKDRVTQAIVQGRIKAPKMYYLLHGSKRLTGASNMVLFLTAAAKANADAR